jgi:hypothetical protein
MDATIAIDAEAGGVGSPDQGEQPLIFDGTV